MADDINTSITNLGTSLDASTAAIVAATTAFNSGVLSIVNGLASIDCSVCPPTGTYPPTDGIDEEQPPPAGFDDYDPAIDDRKCKLANMYFDDLRETTVLLHNNGIDDLGALAIGSMTALLGLIVGLIASGPVGWGLGALGAIAGIIAFFLVESIDLLVLIGILDANAEELVCSLYEATTPDAGKTAFKAVLASGGADAAQLAFIDAINMTVALEVLFFRPDGTYGDDIEVRLDGYVGTIDCAGCVSLGSCSVGFAGVWATETPQGTGSITQDGQWRVLSSTPRDGVPTQHCIALGCGGYNWKGNNPPAGGCAGEDNPLFNWEVQGPTPFPLSFPWQDNGSFAWWCVAGVLTDQGTPPFPSYPEDYEMSSTYLRLVNNVPFSITIRLW